jgi:hypothetical protein
VIKFVSQSLDDSVIEIPETHYIVKQDGDDGFLKDLNQRVSI